MQSTVGFTSRIGSVAWLPSVGPLVFSCKFPRLPVCGVSPFFDTEVRFGIDQSQFRRSIWIWREAPDMYDSQGWKWTNVQAHALCDCLHYPMSHHHFLLRPNFLDSSEVSFFANLFRHLEFSKSLPRLRTRGSRCEWNLHICAYIWSF